jgi:hypothetical protein
MEAMTRLARVATRLLHAKSSHTQAMRVSRNGFTHGMIDLAKSSRRSDMRACHAMDRRSTNQEVDQMNEVHHMLQRRQND